MELLWTLVFAVFLAVASHFFGQALPRNAFKEDRFPYRPLAFEKNGTIYRRLGVHKWMELVPDMSRTFGDMVPKQMKKGMTSEDVRVLIKETCVAEFVHTLLCVVFLFVARIWEDRTWIFFWLIYTACNLPFIIIQRYNRPMLVRLLRHMEARESRLAGRSAEEALTGQ